MSYNYNDDSDYTPVINTRWFSTSVSGTPDYQRSPLYRAMATASDNLDRLVQSRGIYRQPIAEIRHLLMDLTSATNVLQPNEYSVIAFQDFMQKQLAKIVKAEQANRTGIEGDQ